MAAVVSGYGCGWPLADGGLRAGFGCSVLLSAGDGPGSPSRGSAAAGHSSVHGWVGWWQRPGQGARAGRGDRGGCRGDRPSGGKWRLAAPEDGAARWSCRLPVLRSPASWPSVRGGGLCRSGETKGPGRRRPLCRHEFNATPATASTAGTRESVPESLTDSERSGSRAVGSRLPQVRYDQVMV